MPELSVWWITSFLITLTPLVFIHELGHYLVARYYGMAIEAFSIGFGRELFGWTDRYGTRWKISALPLGGYVKFLGDEGPASNPDFALIRALTPEQRASCYANKPVGQRAAVSAAGPIFNFILAYVLLVGLLVWHGLPIYVPSVGAVMPDKPAAAAGLQVNDRILKIDGQEVALFTDLMTKVQAKPGQPIDIEFRRGEAVQSARVTPVAVTVNGREVGQIGIAIGTPDYQTTALLPALTKSAVMITENAGMILRNLGEMVVGQRSIKELGGPIRIAEVSHGALQRGFFDFMGLVIGLSISLGVLNLLPIPMLDGGHLLYYGVEAVRGKALAEKTQEYGFRIGLGLLLSLMIVVNWNDLARHGLFSWLSSMFS